MKDVKTSEIYKATMPFIYLRMGAYFVVTLIMLLIIGVIVGISAAIIGATEGGGGGILLGVALLCIVSVVGFMSIVRRYVLYIVKAGHVSAVTKYLQTGSIPEEGSLAYAKTVITKHFGSTNVAAGADYIISGAVKQIMRFLNKAENLLSFIPGAGVIFIIINKIISLLCNYIDEAVLSYIFIKEDESNSWKKAADGIVYYAQTWKSMLKTSTKLVVGIFFFKILCYIVFLVISYGIFYTFFNGSFLALVMGLVSASILTMLAQGVLIDPYVTIAMIKTYHINIENKELSYDLYGKLSKVSRKFKKLLGKSKEEPEVAA